MRRSTDSPIELPRLITWMGWSTTGTELLKNGWVITKKEKYSNWRDMENSMASHEYIYLRHPETKMLIRIIQDYVIGTNTLVAKVDYSGYEKSKKLRPRVAYDNFMPSDIGNLYEIILKLQGQRAKKRNKKVNTQIRNAA